MMGSIIKLTRWSLQSEVHIYFFDTGCETFFGTKFFRDRFRDFFRYQIFSRPVPGLFSVPNFFETGSETFFGTKFFRDRFRYHQKNWRIPGNGNSRDRDVTLCTIPIVSLQPSTSSTNNPTFHIYSFHHQSLIDQLGLCIHEKNGGRRGRCPRQFFGFSAKF